MKLITANDEKSTAYGPDASEWIRNQGIRVLKRKKAAEVPRLQARNFSAAHFCYIEIFCVISCAAGVAARPPLAVSLSSHGII